MLDFYIFINSLFPEKYLLSWSVLLLEFNVVLICLHKYFYI